MSIFYTTPSPQLRKTPREIKKQININMEPSFPASDAFGISHQRDKYKLHESQTLSTNSTTSRMTSSKVAPREYGAFASKRSVLKPTRLLSSCPRKRTATLMQSDPNNIPRAPLGSPNAKNSPNPCGRELLQNLTLDTSLSTSKIPLTPKSSDFVNATSSFSPYQTPPTHRHDALNNRNNAHRFEVQITPCNYTLKVGTPVIHPKQGSNVNTPCSTPRQVPVTILSKKSIDESQDKCKGAKNTHVLSSNSYSSMNRLPLIVDRMPVTRTPQCIHSPNSNIIEHDTQHDWQDVDQGRYFSNSKVICSAQDQMMKKTQLSNENKVCSLSSPFTSKPIVNSPALQPNIPFTMPLKKTRSCGFALTSKFSKQRQPLLTPSKRESPGSLFLVNRIVSEEKPSRSSYSVEKLNLPSFQLVNTTDVSEKELVKAKPSISQGVINGTTIVRNQQSLATHDCSKSKDGIGSFLRHDSANSLWSNLSMGSHKRLLNYIGDETSPKACKNISMFPSAPKRPSAPVMNICFGSEDLPIDSGNDAASQACSELSDDEDEFFLSLPPARDVPIEDEDFGKRKKSRVISQCSTLFAKTTKSFLSHKVGSDPT